MRHAPTSATREYAFPADEPLDERALAAAGALRAAIPRGYAVASSPSLRCRQTTEAAGLEVGTAEPVPAECDFGAWAGRTLAAIAEAEPDAARTWMEDPDAAPHGGESLRSFASRVAAWLDEQGGKDGALAAITHGGVVKAAVIHALGAPLEAFWRVDVAPLSLTELHAHDGRWTVARVNAAVAP